MERFGLRNDQWERIKDVLPVRVGHVGGTAEDNHQNPRARRRLRKSLQHDADARAGP